MSRAVLIIFVIALPLVLLAAVDEDSKTDPVGYAPAQPITYSHKTHLALGLKCSGCHTMKDAETGEGFTMGFPKEDYCMSCHSSIRKDSAGIVQLAKAAADKKAVEWKRVYRLMPIVWFSHAVHVQEGNINCGTCHGDMASMSVTTKGRTLNMKDCMDCHARSSAPNGCDTCHASQ
jgi:cytochrome c7-like protein